MDLGKRSTYLLLKFWSHMWPLKSSKEVSLRQMKKGLLHTKGTKLLRGRTKRK